MRVPISYVCKPAIVRKGRPTEVLKRSLQHSPQERCFCAEKRPSRTGTSCILASEISAQDEISAQV